MRAVFRDRYGPPGVLRFEEVEMPTPRDGEVLVRESAASLNRADVFQLNPPPMVRLLLGRMKPKRKLFGIDLASYRSTLKSSGA